MLGEKKWPNMSHEKIPVSSSIKNPKRWVTLPTNIPSISPTQSALRHFRGDEFPLTPQSLKKNRVQTPNPLLLLQAEIREGFFKGPFFKIVIYCIITVDGNQKSGVHQFRLVVKFIPLFPTGFY